MRVRAPDEGGILLKNANLSLCLRGHCRHSSETADKNMVTCICHFDLLLLDRPDSLKGKRHVIKSLKERMRSRLGVSVAEVGSQDLLHRGELGVAFVGERQDVLDGVLEALRRLVETDGRVEVLGSTVEFHRS
jgi:uncharacterized protein YlxP (DUF503 family)